MDVGPEGTCANAVVRPSQSVTPFAGAVGGALQVDASGSSHKVWGGGKRRNRSQGGWRGNWAVRLPTHCKRGKKSPPCLLLQMYVYKHVIACLLMSLRCHLHLQKGSCPLQMRDSWHTLVSEPTSSYPELHRKCTSCPTARTPPSLRPFSRGSGTGHVATDNKGALTGVQVKYINWVGD